MKKKICMALAAMLAVGSVPAYAAETQIVRMLVPAPKNAMVYILPLTQKYDEINNIGDGYFIAEKYPDKNVGMGEYISSPENAYFLLDKKGKEVLKYESGTIRDLEDQGEGYLLVRDKDRKEDSIIDRTGKEIFTVKEGWIKPFSEGMAMVFDYTDEDRYGFVDAKGEQVIPMKYSDAKSFAEGLAAVCIEPAYWKVGDEENRREAKWGYIDKSGKVIIEGKYQSAESFHEGLAKIATKDGVGYIDKKGNEVIPPRYTWGGDFHNGRTFVTEEDGRKTWLIDKTGQKRMLITEGDYVSYRNPDSGNNILQKEEIVDLPDGSHEHIITLYDEHGVVSPEDYRRRENLAEGLAPVWDKERKKYGYIDEAGKQIISPIFDKAERFQDGYAVVANEVRGSNGSVDVKWGIIKKP